MGLPASGRHYRAHAPQYRGGIRRSCSVSTQAVGGSERTVSTMCTAFIPPPRAPSHAARNHTRNAFHETCHRHRRRLLALAACSSTPVAQVQPIDGVISGQCHSDMVRGALGLAASDATVARARGQRQPARAGAAP
jgi:hypothetical protein